jgi:8-amino-3,8-dideoxy-alpha-D-manno-octulosonate transaminase
MAGWEIIGEEERRAVNEVFDNGAVLFRHGFVGMRNNVYKVKELEQAFAKHLGARHAQAVTSGTAALKVGLEALGVGRGDEVITQSHTFVATVEAILECGAVPVITDIDESLNMDPSDLEARITKKTKVIIPVHMLGVPAKMEEILRIADSHGIPVLEDTAQGLGGHYRGRALGTLGKVGTFSFDHGKILTTGEGGMVVTNDESVYRSSKAYHDHGHEDNPAFPRGEDTRSRSGFNYRMMELQGAIGLVQLEKLDGSLARQRANKAALKRALDAAVVRPLHYRELPDAAGDTGDAVVFFLDTPEQAKKVARTLLSRGVGFKNLPDAINWHYAGTWDHLLGDMAWLGGKSLVDYFDKSERILRRALALPIFYKMDDARIATIAEEVARAIGEVQP